MSASPVQPTPQTLRTARLTLEPLAHAHAEELLAYYTRNRAYLEPWDPTPDETFFTLARQQTNIARVATEWQNGNGVRFIAREPDSEIISAIIGLSNIRRGVAHAAIISYSVDEHKAGRGYATELVERVTTYAFDDLKLHRLEASYQPENRGSGRVLKKAGFIVEGYARDHLFLNRAWRDGVLVSRTNDAWVLPA